MQMKRILVFVGISLSALFFVTSLAAADGSNIDLTNGLVAYYPFEGNANDESGNENNGNIYGALPTEDRDENSNSAYGFDGSWDYITVPTFTALDMADGLSIMFWIKPHPNPLRSLILSSGPDLEIELAGDAIRAFNLSGSLTNNVWTHFCVTLDQSGAANLFLNGTPVSGPSQVTRTSILTSLLIGAGFNQLFGGHNSFYFGSLDEFMIYSRALTQEEIRFAYSGEASQGGAGDMCPEVLDSDHDGVIDLWDLCPDTPPETWVDNQGCAMTMESFSNVKMPGLLCQWTFDEGAGEYLEDAVGDLDGNIVGATWTDEGIIGGALHFNGEANYVHIENGLDFERDEAFTISLWVKRDSVGRGLKNVMISKMLSKGTKRGWMIWFKNDRVSFKLCHDASKRKYAYDDFLEYLSNNGFGLLKSCYHFYWPERKRKRRDLLEVTTRNRFTDTNCYYHIVVTYDGSSRADGVNIYVDGKSQLLNSHYKRRSVSGSTVTEAPLNIGARDNNSRWPTAFSGLIDEVSLYDRALAPEEVVYLYRETNALGLLFN
jgi:hypothetical protein